MGFVWDRQVVIVAVFFGAVILISVIMSLFQGESEPEPTPIGPLSTQQEPPSPEMAAAFVKVYLTTDYRRDPERRRDDLLAAGAIPGLPASAGQSEFEVERATEFRISSRVLQARVVEEIPGAGFIVEAKVENRREGESIKAVYSCRVNYSTRNANGTFRDIQCQQPG